MKVLKILIIVLVIIVAAFLIIAAFLPSKFHVEQTVEIDRPVEYAFNEINTLPNWVNWSPFDDEDTSMVTTYSGPASGIGASSAWVSEKQGNGSMIITESIPFEKVITTLDFGEQGVAIGYFDFEEIDGKTKLTWGMDSDVGYPIERVVFVIMQSMMEDVFLNGLNSIKEVCEAKSFEPDSKQIINASVIIPAVAQSAEKIVAMKDNLKLNLLKVNKSLIATIMDSCSMDQMEAALGADYGELKPYVMTYHGEDFGYPFTIWHTWDEENMFGSFEAGISVMKKTLNEGRIKIREFGPVNVVAGLHYGPYDQTMYMYEGLQEYLKVNNLIEVGGPIELYVTDPGQEPDAEKWQTIIMFQVK